MFVFYLTATAKQKYVVIASSPEEALIQVSDGNVDWDEEVVVEVDFDSVEPYDPS